MDVGVVMQLVGKKSTGYLLTRCFFFQSINCSLICNSPHPALSQKKGEGARADWSKR
jgi:hypothetical protein